MRQNTVEFAEKVWKRHNIHGHSGRVLEIGGTSEVFFQYDGTRLLSLRQSVRNFLVKLLNGEPRIKHPIKIQPNPLLEIFPNLEFLDRGFNHDNIDGADQDFQLDFTIDEDVAPLENQFDMAVSFDTLEHINDPWAFCRNMMRVVKPGGWVYLQTVFRYQYHPSPQDYYRFSPMGLRECFKNSGGEVIECDWEDREESPYILLRKPE